ncbi:hypothetical protein [Shewanella sp. GD03713]|uniref:hypothetical protein n=1 Tax=Shewanella TaxID=22 RepID=UPI00244684CD|nr:hypothetical protein [Shewanella sp. GD03713]MDH1472584.1 hypothetical protein [Shewanella sp. GD03713]
MTLSQQAQPVAYFYYGKKFIGAAMLESSISNAFEVNRAYCHSVSRECIPYLLYCTHVSIAYPELDKEVDVSINDPLWNVENCREECLKAFA